RLPNRRALAQRFLQEMQRARRHHNSIAFMMVDIDHFKQVNDTYGHLNGDAVLAELAQILVTGARESDVCARYGGEEFALILHETTESGARVLAERIRAKVAAATFPGGLKMTISVGVAATEEPALLTQLIDRADPALYAGGGLWCLPGGFVNHDEEPADAAVRECMEEIGAAVELTELLGLYHVPKTAASSIIGVAYRGRLAGGAKTAPGPEMLELGVFTRD